MHGSDCKNDRVTGPGQGSGFSNFKRRSGGWGGEGKYFGREINKEPHTPQKFDVSLKEAKATGPFGDYQEVWVTCRQKDCISDRIRPFLTG